MEPLTVFEEVQFRTRLYYLAFKRAVWLVETLILAALLIALHSIGVYPNLLITAAIIQCARVIASGYNHVFLAGIFNAPDAFDAA